MIDTKATMRPKMQIENNPKFLLRWIKLSNLDDAQLENIKTIVLEQATQAGYDEACPDLEYYLNTTDNYLYYFDSQKVDEVEQSDPYYFTRICSICLDSQYPIVILEHHSSQCYSIHSLDGHKLFEELHDAQILYGGFVLLRPHLDSVWNLCKCSINENQSVICDIVQLGGYDTDLARTPNIDDRDLIVPDTNGHFVEKSNHSEPRNTERACHDVIEMPEVFLCYDESIQKQTVLIKALITGLNNQNRDFSPWLRAFPFIDIQHYFSKVELLELLSNGQIDLDVWPDRVSNQVIYKSIKRQDILFTRTNLNIVLNQISEWPPNKWIKILEINIEFFFYAPQRIKPLKLNFKSLKLIVKQPNCNYKPEVEDLLKASVGSCNHKEQDFLLQEKSHWIRFVQFSYDRLIVSVMDDPKNLLLIDQELISSKWALILFNLKPEVIEYLGYIDNPFIQKRYNEFLESRRDLPF